MTVEQLQQLSALLDEALALDDDAARLAWIQSLGPDAEPVLPTLRRLLLHQARHETADFIDGGPQFTAPEDTGGTPPAAAFGSGESIGPYRLLRALGRGGMGEVWLAERTDGQLRREVALKLPLSGLRRALLVQRFARERDILAALQHPNIARLYDAGMAADGQPYLALEYVQGDPITQHVRLRRLGTREVWRIATVLALGAGARIRPELRPAKCALWAHGFTVAHAARGIAESAGRDGIDADRVYVAALLHDIGLSVLLSVEPERCLAMLAKASDPAIGFSVQVEREVGLPPHARIGGEVCRTWGLPADVVTLVGSHGLVHPLDLPARLRACGAALELGHQLAERTAPPEGVRRHPERDDAPLLATFLRVSPARIEAIRASIEAAGPRIAEIARGA